MTNRRFAPALDNLETKVVPATISVTPAGVLTVVGDHSAVNVVLVTESADKQTVNVLALDGEGVIQQSFPTSALTGLAVTENATGLDYSAVSVDFDSTVSGAGDATDIFFNFGSGHADMTLGSGISVVYAHADDVVIGTPTVRFDD
jgi:hypothetical protein